MWRAERNTDRRGRSGVPLIFLRTRRWRRIRASRLLFVIVSCLLVLLGGLAGLALHVLVDVPDALALVRLGWAALAEIGRHLADELLVGAPHHDTGGLGDLERDALGRLERHRVGKPHLELELRRALGLGPVGDPDDLELAAEPLGDAHDHVVHERTGQAVERTVLALVVGPRDDQGVAVAADADRLGRPVGEGAVRTLDNHLATLDGHLDPGRDGDRLFADARHDRLPLPDLTEDLAADVTLARLPVGHEALVGGQDRDAHASEHTRELVGARVHAQAGLRHAPDPRDRALPVRRVLQDDP